MIRGCGLIVAGCGRTSTTSPSRTINQTGELEFPHYAQRYQLGGCRLRPLVVKFGSVRKDLSSRARTLSCRDASKISTPCGAMSTRGVSSFVPGFLDLHVNGKTYDEGI